MGKYFKLIRIKHWIKNMLIFVPVFFSKQIFDINQWIYLICGFLSFSLSASFIYIINDINDVELDRLNPSKSKRPIANGEIPINKATVISIIILLISLLINLFIQKNSFSILILLAYIIINILYSKGLKNLPVLDLIILSSGFVLRVIYGAMLSNVRISTYLYLTVLTMSLYLSLGKRRNEIKNSKKARTVLKSYTYQYLNGYMYMCQGLFLIFYSLWCSDEITIQRTGNTYLLYTLPLVLIICLTYNYICENNSDGDPVEVITNSKSLLFLGIVLCISITLIIY